MILSKLSLATGFIVGALTVGSGSYLFGYYSGASAGYDRAIAERAAATERAELERKDDDAKLQTLSDYDLCVASLAGDGLSVAPCEQLRRVPKEQP